MNTTEQPEPTDQQLDDIKRLAADYANGHTHFTALCGPACTMASGVSALVAEVRRLRAAPAVLPSAPAVDLASADNPTPLRWGLNDVLWGDDDTVTVLLSGPQGEPYWLELDPERAGVLREDLAGPDGEQPVEVTPPPALTEEGRLRAQVEVLQQDAERDRGLAKVGARCMREGHQGLIEQGRAVIEGWRFALSVALGLGTGAPWEAIHERAKELAALPARAGRAAILREVADELEGINFHPTARDRCLDLCRALAGRFRRKADEAERLAGEAPQPETQPVVSVSAVLRWACDHLATITQTSPGEDPRQPGLLDAIDRLRWLADEAQQPQTQAEEVATETQDAPPVEPHPTEADLRHALAVFDRFHGRDANAPAEPEPETQRCPQCGDSLANYSTDDLVYLVGDERPYCSGECVIRAHRAALKTAPAAGSAEGAQQ